MNPVFLCLTMIGWSSVDSPVSVFHTDELMTTRVAVSDAAPAPEVFFEDAQHPDVVAYVRHVVSERIDGHGLALTDIRHSLLGVHYTFQQTLMDRPILGAQMIVSVSSETGRVFRISHTALPPDAKRFAAKADIELTEEDAFEVAWSHLGGHRLTAAPQAVHAWMFDGQKLIPVHQVSLAVDDPPGNWVLAIHATTGDVLAERDINLYRHGRESPRTQRPSPATSFVEARSGWEARHRAAESAAVAAKAARADGVAMVFDPDPLTTLMDDSLEDGSPPEAFEGAYLQRTLRDITFDSETYVLDGPYCRIRNLEPPNTAPSTTMDGVWDFRRGNNAFNDATTYFHIDQNQRYLQRLGFTADKAIQAEGLAVDTDGEFGADNSHYAPLDNVLVFGHGCVDDNEDADVIIHEYGHAIQYGIYDNWYGGDTGAIAEGLSDYWAGSYSYSTPNGRDFHPEWMFTWDGHNACWSGRVMNALTAQYDPNQTYSAHQNIGGGYQSDELFSTPLFQALVELTDQGVPITQVDQIITEAQFGAFLAMRMPQMAEVIVETAATFHPSGPHAGLFRASFARHNILEPIASHEYISAHIPPTDESPVAWKCEIALSNPGSQPTQVQVEVFGNDDHGVGSSVFELVHEETLSLAPGQTINYQPPGLLQRWVRFTSTRPITGSSAFYRTAVVERGEERVAMPLFDETHRGARIVYAHVPEDRAKFWSGSVVVNPHDVPLTLDISLIGDQGNDLSHLLMDQQVTLAAHQKWVSYLTGGVFDDSSSTEKVAYVAMTAAEDILGFELYGFQDGSGSAATAGIMALPEQRPSWWALRCALTDVDWVGISVLNPSSEQRATSIKVLDRSGAVLQEAAYSHQAKTKILGLLDASGFVYPYRRDPGSIISTTSPEIGTVIVQSDAPLRVFELSGDHASTILDGSAVRGGQSRVMFQNPSGIMQIINGDRPSLIDVTPLDENGHPLHGFVTQIEADAWSLTERDVTTWNAASIRVQGRNLAAFMVHRDDQAESLTIMSPTQILGLVESP